MADASIGLWTVPLAVFGFGARVAGGNIRAAKIVGLSVGKLILTVCFIAGSCAGLAMLLFRICTSS